MGTLRPLADALSRVRVQLQGFVPEVAKSMEKTAEALNDVLSVSVPDSSIGDFSSPLNTESVESILKDAEELASRKLREELDKVDEADLKPIIEYIRSNGVESIQAVVDNMVDSLTTEGLESVVEESVSSSKNGGLLYVKVNESESDTYRRVYEYIKSKNGVLELSSCCRDLGLSRESVITALRTLESQGKIKLDHQPV
ncbi:MAG: hypothetical protein QW613_02715 [Thermoprotei archaeon]